MVVAEVAQQREGAAASTLDQRECKRLVDSKSDAGHNRKREEEDAEKKAVVHIDDDNGNRR